MISYREISNRDDKKFHRLCRKELGIKLYNQVASIASLHFQEAYKNEPNELKKENSARRAANLVYCHALKLKKKRDEKLWKV